MDRRELIEIREKMIFLEKVNPRKFENLKGRLDAIYEKELEEFELKKQIKN